MVSLRLLSWCSSSADHHSGFWRMEGLCRRGQMWRERHIHSSHRHFLSGFAALSASLSAHA